VDPSLTDAEVEAVSTDLWLFAAFSAALNVATTALRNYVTAGGCDKGYDGRLNATKRKALG